MTDHVKAANNHREVSMGLRGTAYASIARAVDVKSMKKEYAQYMISWIEKIESQFQSPISDSYEVMKAYWSGSGVDFNEGEMKGRLWAWVDGNSGPREPLNNSVIPLACRAVHNQGAASQECLDLSRSRNAECESLCKPRRAGLEGHSCCVAALAKGYGHSRRAAPNICSLQDPQRHYGVIQRLPRITSDQEMAVTHMVLCLAYKDEATMDEIKDIGFFEDLLEQYGYSRSEINRTYDQQNF
ncbi:hypothetical protein [Microbulbifer sp. VAAF005]|uniref:hypothetical protein n=1 Tax=Microbulbifer sp. VAAF005 TaxID=3034230 RepID=UPI0024ADC038|nr:hypothetical protein [Microbulbifer sp. VAAF005]WHI46423.1 hypothetical protein P0078_22380 [Microbulbifer sp. VAAF005]